MRLRSMSTSSIGRRPRSASTGASGAQSAARTARNQQAEQGVEPTDRPGPGRGEVVVTVRQQAQHRGMIGRSDRTQPGVSQRDDRRGPGVVRVGLVGPTRVEQPHPRRQRRRHIHDALTGGDELLREQRTRDRRRLRPPRCAARTVPRTATAGRVANDPQSTRSWPTSCSASSSTAAVCDRLCGSIPITNITSSFNLTVVGMPRRAVLMKGDCSPLSSHAAARTRPAATSLRSQPTTAAGHY